MLPRQVTPLHKKKIRSGSTAMARRGVDEVEAVAKYEASGGYIAYRYAHDRKRSTLRVEFTGSNDDVELQLLLPARASLRRAIVDGVDTRVTTPHFEKSAYARVLVTGVGAHVVEARLQWRPQPDRLRN
jgi:hypothetical protein